jgi:hypothetical protein
MRDVTRTLGAGVAPAVDRYMDASGRCHDPACFIERGTKVEKALERLALTEGDIAMRAVYRDMAAVYHRANMDATRIWRDVNG